MKTLREALRSEELTLTAELTLDPRTGPEAVVEQAKVLAEKTDAVQIPDHRHARPHLSNVAVAALLLKNGIDPIIQMNCRDRNRVALQSDIVGVRALGASNLLLLRGPNFPAGHRPQSTGVFDVGAIELLATAAMIRDGDAFPGTAPAGAPDLYLGTVATAFPPSESWEPEKLTSKADAGAQFIQLQPCLDMDLLQAYVAKIVDAKLTWRFQLLAGLVVLPSAEAAREFRTSRSDSIIPPAVVQRLEAAGDPSAEGVKIAAEQLAVIAGIPGMSGVTLVTPGAPELIPAAIRTAGMRN
ncbi:MAG: methylenetetrahydrofolate reductase [Gammaproteobacteria bacterium]|nr:methylenetetrahydrofolate reductase [Gammaproteobacteria bacterium]